MFTIQSAAMRRQAAVGWIELINFSCAGRQRQRQRSSGHRRAAAAAVQQSNALHVSRGSHKRAMFRQELRNAFAPQAGSGRRPSPG